MLIFSLQSELSIAQLLGFLVVEHVHPDLSHRLETSARIFQNLFWYLMAL